MRFLSFVVILFIAFQANAQHPGVDCVPVQGNGWQGCAPVGNNNQATQPPPARWLDQYGAIVAYGQGGELGVSANKMTEEEAKQAAMTDCQAQGGGSHCEFLISYANGCVAMLVGDKAFNASSDSTIEKATQDAKRVCTKNGKYQLPRLLHRMQPTFTDSMNNGHLQIHLSYLPVDSTSMCVDTLRPCRELRLRQGLWINGAANLQEHERV